MNQKLCGKNTLKRKKRVKRRGPMMEFCTKKKYPYGVVCLFPNLVIADEITERLQRETGVEVRYGTVMFQLPAILTTNKEDLQKIIEDNQAFSTVKACLIYNLNESEIGFFSDPKETRIEWLMRFEWQDMNGLKEDLISMCPLVACLFEGNKGIHLDDRPTESDFEYLRLACYVFGKKIISYPIFYPYTIYLHPQRPIYPKKEKYCHPWSGVGVKINLP